MTKEELEKEAEEYVKQNYCEMCVMADDCKCGCIDCFTVQAYLASAEPREKEIKSLGERCLQLQKDKGNLTDSVNNLEVKLANADYQLEGRDLEIKELKAQIEKMKSCANCKHQCSFLFQDEIDCANNGLPKWEIKENDNAKK